AEAVVFVGINVDGDGVFPLIEGVSLHAKPIAASDESCEVGNRPGIKNANTVRTQTTGRDDIAGKAPALICRRARICRLRVLDECGFLSERISGIEQLAEVPLPHFE